MSRLRITCKGDPPAKRPDGSAYPITISRCAEWPDLELELVDEDGRTMPITNVTRVVWVAEQGTEPARARVDFVDVDVELEARLPGAEVMRAALAWRKACRDNAPNAGSLEADLALAVDAHEERFPLLEVRS